MLVLGIETSCDETSVALVDHNKKILCNYVYSQIKEHEQFKGVVPEIAARKHVEMLPKLLLKLEKEFPNYKQDISAVAVTAGPGLIGGLMVGLMTAKGLAQALNKHFIAVNHLEGHALSVRLCHDVEYPYLLALLSGGHCQIIETQEFSKYNVMGATIDDAIGEAFDKVAKMLDLGYPGGKEIEALAKKGDAQAFKLPEPLTKGGGCDFSFSGLKTAVNRVIAKQESLTENVKANIAASFQFTVCNILVKKLEAAIKIYIKREGQGKVLAIAGGVAANKAIRNALDVLALKYGFRLVFPPMALCTDNAAMIAWVGVEKLQNGQINDLSFPPKARWSLC